ncbi:WYL domain-containing protein [Nostoc punctiforme FACHB-252]|uniref:WYL domain-containing protein n=1 Tax=Nostoc punctiforme FACHB-252 TaxID=1357509 RepID=A0ABR8HM73_NOSPU|nr:WYL domain-containing protein [Nostoc punctiforme]MBD2616304.1 WYL domain-containing protein [Nostoc punctiforme FACHB-252]
MSKKKNLGDDFSFPKFKGVNGIKSPKRSFLPEPPLPNIKVSEPSLPDFITGLIKQAITQKRLIEFYYQGLHRIAEPHILGLKDEAIQVLVYQVRGKSSSIKLPDWRRMNLDDMSRLQILDETFSPKPPSLYDCHSSWDEILAIVS